MRDFKQDVKASGYIHRPLPLDSSRSFEKQQLEKEAIANRRPLTDNFQNWQQRGRGEIQQTEETVTLLSATRYDTWAKGAPEDGDYVNFGEVGAYLPIPREDWSEFTQIKLDIAAECVNVINPNITITLENDGEIKIPDIYNREGTHVINLEGQAKRTYVLDISNLPRDVVTGIRIFTGANGSYMNLQGQLSYTISSLFLEQNQNSTSAKGWKVPSQEIVFSHIGYHPDYSKTAIINSEDFTATTFELKSEDTVIFQGEIQETTTENGTFGVLDFSTVKEPGTYYLQIADTKTPNFQIGAVSTLKADSIWKSLNFIFCERCGCPVHGIHGTCHEDLTVEYKGALVSFNGGWHDAGDLSQQLVQTSEVTSSLFEAAETVKDQPDLYLRLIEEGEWGIDFILKTRLDEGDRVTSAGITRWTDNRIGTMDDAVPRIHNSPYDNFLITGLLAKIIKSLPQDYAMRSQLLQVVEEDYQYAFAGFKKTGFKHEPIFWEHTYNISKSLFLATMSWTAALMYQLTAEETYQEQMTEWFDELLTCQEQTGLKLFDGTILKGMFYRDETHKVFQHFNHQAREHLYALAFEEVLTASPKHAKAEKWLERANEYGDYLDYLGQFTDPYPMYASGIYREDEWQDKESFYRQHLLVDDEAEVSNQEQLKQGIKIGDGLYIKRFPVWFSFRGNNGILLSMGKSAAVLGRLLNRPALLDKGHQQLQWMVGKNPFGQSMIYGEGYNYPQQYSVSSGELTGEMPVGMQTFGNEDQPYWPQFNNATYKEVWVGVAGKWLSLVAELIKSEKGYQFH
ncbi:glycoside hydrolase family 9 protein [Enterococcus hulanensis]|uniref:glycoside hydrolase family 9 protein n=1 Tax=Enterococcus hulanensis TaxID=2559929 RepID=UPI00288E6769|nr:glycoside hydrolase family 9 protein [Enterococcus hulanensis]MDT2660106.1 glycoside hydrolase family 9 protein [Enterococcus hulanensis]